MKQLSWDRVITALSQPRGVTLNCHKSPCPYDVIRRAMEYAAGGHTNANSSAFDVHDVVTKSK